jgi:hypothetical protein
VLVEDADDGQARIWKIRFTTPRELPAGWKLTDIDGNSLTDAEPAPAPAPAPAVLEPAPDSEEATAATLGLKLWNGRGGDWRGVSHVYLCARSAADAVRILRAAGHSRMSAHELKTYFAPTWGIAMKGIRRERGVWVSRPGKYQVERVELPEGV